MGVSVLFLARDVQAGLFFACAALVRLVALRRWPFFELFACAALVRLCAYGIGLSLIC
jgi:hypothetical protein